MGDIWTRRFLAAAIVVLFAAALYALFRLELPEGTKEVLLVMLGALASEFRGVFAFHFGSSDGSKVKDTKGPPPIGG